MKPGDVVIVTQLSTDGKHDWRWFGVITRIPKKGRWIELWRLGDWERKVTIRANDNNFHVLEEDKWPDGVWALRTRAILEGKIEIL